MAFIAAVGVSAMGVLAGCASSPEKPRVSLVPIDSAIVDVTTVRLEKASSGEFLSGTVRRRPRADDTSRSHLDVRFIAPSGDLIAEQIEYFAPRQVPTAFRGVPGNSKFRTRINLPSESLGRIEVQAHDAPHTP
jgi:hypothetical protein